MTFIVKVLLVHNLGKRGKEDVHVNWVVTRYGYLLHVEIAIIFGTTSFKVMFLVTFKNWNPI